MIAIMPFDTTALAKDIESIYYNKIIINIYSASFSMKNVSN